MNYYTKLSIRIIILFITIIFASFIPDYFHSFFGDIYCTKYYGNCDYPSHKLPIYHWGYRHWIWATMGFLLFIVQFIKTFNDK